MFLWYIYVQVDIIFHILTRSYLKMMFSIRYVYLKLANYVAHFKNISLVYSEKYHVFTSTNQGGG